MSQPKSFWPTFPPHLGSFVRMPTGAPLRILISAALLLIFLPEVKGRQSPAPKTSVNSEQPGSDQRANEGDQISTREEMLKNLEIRRRDVAYQDNLEKAKECARLGSEVREVFENQRTLGGAEIKKLSRLEKLTRSIREAAGGGEDEESAKELPDRLEDTLRRLAEVSEVLRQRVEKTPKHVVSAAVITEANQLLSLVRHIKTFRAR